MNYRFGTAGVLPQKSSLYECRISLTKYTKNINTDPFRFRFLSTDLEDFLVDFIDDSKEHKVRFVHTVFLNSFVC